MSISNAALAVSSYVEGVMDACDIIGAIGTTESHLHIEAPKLCNGEVLCNALKGKYTCSVRSLTNEVGCFDAMLAVTLSCDITGASETVTVRIAVVN